MRTVTQSNLQQFVPVACDGPPCTLEIKEDAATHKCTHIAQAAQFNPIDEDRE